MSVEAEGLSLKHMRRANAPDPSPGPRARRWFVVVLALFVLAQPLAAWAGRWNLERWGSAGNVYNQWRGFEGKLSPDVVFVGDSRVRADVDPTLIEDALARAGVRAMVTSIGIDAGKPVFMRALVGRLIERRPRPRTVVLAVSEFQLNAEFDRTDAEGSQTRYYWQLGGPTDLGLVARSVRSHSDPGLLVTGWLLPLVANYSVVLEGFRCDLSALRGRDDCVDEYRDRARPMDEATLARWQRIFSEQYLARFTPSTSQVSALEGSIQDLRSAGIDVTLVILPVYQVAELDPPAYRRFLQTVEGVAARTGVTLVDRHDLFDARRDLFFNQNHLTTVGTREVTPVLTDIVRPRL